ncbi:MAG TPA: cyclic-di-AMP-binding protein CbpB [Bacillota bacterium]|nr:cyclic-di-AMP-binding protein CbpB [Bacillota bacterium]
MDLIKDSRLTDLTVENLMILEDKVAHVQLNNPLEHALLVLVKSGYSAVPVLDNSYKLVGTIGKTVILDHIIGLERFEGEKLSEKYVHEVVNTEIPILKKEDTLLTGLDKVINYPFVCVVDEGGYFAGILTRRAILKQMKRDYYQKGNDHQ